MKFAFIPIAAALGAVAVAAPRGSPQPARMHDGTTAAMQQGPDGRILYLKNCRQCHGARGEPSDETKDKYPKIATLDDSAFLAKLTDKQMADVVKNGKGKNMKSFSDRLTDAEIAAVVQYVRTLPERKHK